MPIIVNTRIWNIYNRTNGIISTKIAIFAKITPCMHKVYQCSYKRVRQR